MTHLNIQQGLNIEVVSTNLIKKLYEAALSVPEPLEGELDAAYMSGNLLVNKSYRALVEYLTNRFDDLHINVTDSYYIPFEDSAVLNVLFANNIGSDGIGVTEAEAANATLTSAMFKNNTDITSFDEFKYFTKANTNPPNLLFMGCSSLSSVDLSNVTILSSEEFRGTALTNVVLPENITTIPDNWSSWTRSLVSVTAPGVLVINSQAFDLCCGLTSFSDFSNVTKIGQNAFLNAPLTGVFNAPNLTTLGTLAFKGHNFEGIECIGTVSFIPVNCFGHDTVYRTLLYVYLPYECIRLDNGSLCRALELTTIKQYDKTISDYQEGETKTFLPNLGKITIFGDLCFRECKALTLTGDDITNATQIGGNAFYQCHSLTGAISLPHLTSIGLYAFYNCTGITSVDLTGSTITSIPSGCFSGCSNLSEIVLPTTVTLLGNDWGNSTPSSIYIEGLDNVSSHSTYNWDLLNKIITNPIKTSLTSVLSIFKTSGSGTSNIHSLYYPSKLNTFVGLILSSFVWNTEFLYTSQGGIKMTIGLLYYKDLTSFGEATFRGCTIHNLVINNTTPPTHTLSENIAESEHQVWGSALFPTGSDTSYPYIGTLWVPDSAVSTYQANPLYSGLTIKGINTKTNGVDYDLPRYATYADWKTAEAAAVAQGGHAPQGLIEAWM